MHETDDEISSQWEWERVGNQGMISSIGLYWDWSINQSIALLINQSNNWFTKRVFYIHEHIFISNSDPQWKWFVIKIQIYTHLSKPIHGVEKKPIHLIQCLSWKITSDEDNG